MYTITCSVIVRRVLMQWIRVYQYRRQNKFAHIVGCGDHRLKNRVALYHRIDV